MRFSAATTRSRGRTLMCRDCCSASVKASRTAWPNCGSPPVVSAISTQSRGLNASTGGAELSDANRQIPYPAVTRTAAATR